MLKNLVMALVFTCSAAPLALAQTTSKVAVVDMQKAIQSTEAGKKAKKELETEFEKRKKELQKKETDLKKMGDDLEKKRTVLSEEVLGKKQAEMQEEMMKYRESLNKNQMEIQKKEQDLTRPILDKMKKVIADQAKSGGYTLVLENSAVVLYAESATDLTDQVIKAFEKVK